MSNRKTKLTPDIFFQGRLNSNADGFDRIMDVLARVYDNNRNRMVLDGLRQITQLALVHFPETTEDKENSKPDIGAGLLAQFDILNDRLDSVIQKLNHLQEMGFSPQIINAAMDSGSEIDPALADEIRAQFLANNQ